MKKVFSIFFTVLFCLTSSVGWSLDYKDLVVRDGISYKKFSDVPFTGKVNGQYNVLVKNGILVGPYISYWDNGQLNFKGDFKNGKREGAWIQNWENGKLKEEGKYKNDKREGSWFYYWINGQLFQKGKYKNDEKEGSWVGYNSDGTIFELYTGTFKDGQKISD